MTLVTLLLLLFGFAGGLAAQCEPGYIPVTDCSARDAHLKDCKQSYVDKLAMIGAAYTGCRSACTQDDSDERSECREKRVSREVLEGSRCSCGRSQCGVRPLPFQGSRVRDGLR